MADALNDAGIVGAQAAHGAGFSSSRSVNPMLSGAVFRLKGGPITPGLGWKYWLEVLAGNIGSVRQQ
nr:hypothetical protein [Bradyrhizobium sp.]